MTDDEVNALVAVFMSAVLEVEVTAKQAATIILLEKLSHYIQYQTPDAVVPVVAAAHRLQEVTEVQL